MLQDLAKDHWILFAKIVFGVMQRVRGHAQRGGNATPDAATLGIEHLATTDLVLPTESQPRGKGGSISI
jgi:hypothetical protein